MKINEIDLELAGAVTIGRLNRTRVTMADSETIRSSYIAPSIKTIYRQAAHDQAFDGGLVLRGVDELPEHDFYDLSLDGRYWVPASPFVSNLNAGAIADGEVHYLSEWFDTLEDAQARYRKVLSLNETIDSVTLQVAIDYIEKNTNACLVRLHGHGVRNRPVQINRDGFTLQGDGTGYDTQDWRQLNYMPIEGTVDRMVDDNGTSEITASDECRILMTRREYRGSLDAPEDPYLATGISGQACGVRLRDIRFYNHYDPALVQADLGTVIPAVTQTLNSAGEAIAPGYWGAPAVTVPNYWGAGWDVGFLSNSRQQVLVQNCNFIGFREAGIVFSGANTGSAPPLKDWRGEDTPAIKLAGSDLCVAEGCQVWGSKYAIKVIGAKAAPGLSSYGSFYTDRGRISVLANPVGGEILHLGGASTYSVFEFVGFNSGTGLWNAVTTSTNIPIKVQDTLENTMQEAAYIIHRESVRLRSSGYTVNRLFYTYPGWRSDKQELSFVSYNHLSISTNFTTGFKMANPTSNTSIFTVQNSGNVETGQGDYAPYFWATEDTDPADYAGWGYNNGSISDNRTSVGQSDTQIIRCNLRGLRKGSKQVGQIDPRRRHWMDVDRGATIIVDGACGNSSGRIQKIFIERCRIANAGLGTAFLIGKVNWIEINGCIPDEEASVISISSVAENSWGWYQEMYQDAVRKVTIANGAGDPIGGLMTSPTQDRRLFSPLTADARQYTFVNAFNQNTPNVDTDTYTITLAGVTTPGTMSAAIAAGTYTRVDRNVMYGYRLSGVTWSVAASGNIKMQLPPGLPIADLSNSILTANRIDHMEGVTLPVGKTYIYWSLSSADPGWVYLRAGNYLDVSVPVNYSDINFSTFQIRGQLGWQTSEIR
jgi:hypothetical protein